MQGGDTTADKIRLWGALDGAGAPQDVAERRHLHA